MVNRLLLKEPHYMGNIIINSVSVWCELVESFPYLIFKFNKLIAFLVFDFMLVFDKNSSLSKKWIFIIKFVFLLEITI